MSAWRERTIEERDLLNPAFCAVVLWELARGYEVEASSHGGAVHGLPLELAFIGASFVLRGQTRHQLPRDTRTSLATWINDHPLERSAVGKGVVVLRPYIRDAIIFGTQHGGLGLIGTSVSPVGTISKRIGRFLKTASNEVRDCAQKAQLVGRWLYKSGTPTTVMSLLGVHT